MKFNEYPESVQIAQNDIFLKDGADGTKKVKYDTLENQIKTKTKKEIKEEESTDEYMDTQRWALLDNPNLKNSIFRGKNLGSEYTAAQKAAIQSGTFEGLFLGDYWEIGEIVYRIMHFNYWLRTGNNAVTKNHLLIMPDQVLYDYQMNTTDTTSGGYLGSKMYTEGLDQAKETINSSFGSDNLLTHSEILTNAVQNSRPAGGAWTDLTIDLPNEPLIYGAFVFSQGGSGNSLSLRYNYRKTPASLLYLEPKFIVSSNRKSYWLRDVCSDLAFSVVGNDGSSTFKSAQASFGVRPVFGLC